MAISKEQFEARSVELFKKGLSSEAPKPEEEVKPAEMPPAAEKSREEEIEGLLKEFEQNPLKEPDFNERWDKAAYLLREEKTEQQGKEMFAEISKEAEEDGDIYNAVLAAENAHDRKRVRDLFQRYPEVMRQHILDGGIQGRFLLEGYIDLYQAKKIVWEIYETKLEDEEYDYLKLFKKDLEYMTGWIDELFPVQITGSEEAKNWERTIQFFDWALQLAQGVEEYKEMDGYSLVQLVREEVRALVERQLKEEKKKKGIGSRLMKRIFK